MKAFKRSACALAMHTYERILWRNLEWVFSHWPFMFLLFHFLLATNEIADYAKMIRNLAQLCHDYGNYRKPFKSPYMFVCLFHAHATMYCIYLYNKINIFLLQSI